MRGGGKSPKKEAAEVVGGFLPRPLEYVVLALAALYLVALAVGTSGKDPLGPHLPETFEHFVRVPGLFPQAATDVIDYRLEAWSCRDRAYHELDVAPYFPMHADDKESRFQRLGFFFRRNPTVLRAFDAWIVAAHNRPHDPDGVDGPIGGIRLFSLRLPVPPVGEMDRFRRPPLASLPASVKKEWYRTAGDERAKRCEGATP